MLALIRLLLHVLDLGASHGFGPGLDPNGLGYGPGAGADPNGSDYGPGLDPDG